MRVLIIDGYLDAAEMLCALLSHHGFPSRFVPSLDEARHVIEAGAVDVVFLDVALLGHNTSALAMDLRERANHRMVLVAYTLWRDRRIPLGFDLAVCKPATADEFLDVLATAASRLSLSRTT